MPSTLKKAARIQEYLQERNKENITIEVDGNITPENGAKLKKMEQAFLYVVRRVYLRERYLIIVVILMCLEML